MISDENEKLEARSIDNDVIALCCVMGSAQQLFGSFDMAGNNGIPNVFVPPNVQPHHGANGNGTVPEQPKPAENIKVQIAIKKHLFQGVPGGPMVDIGQVGEAPELFHCIWTELTCTVHNVLKYLAHSFAYVDMHLHHDVKVQY